MAFPATTISGPAGTIDRSGRAPYFPFSAFLGYSVARRVLLCTLIDPTLRGVILSGPIGTGKSALMRSFGAFVRTHIDRDAPFVQVPLGVTDDRLIGGIDLDATLEAGTRCRRDGLLADADEGFLFVDDLPLLDATSTAVITAALDAESLICEREGISSTSPSRFQLLATVVPSERDLPISVADRVAFLIAHERRISSDSAQALVRRLERFSRNPKEFYAEFEGAEQELARNVVAARLLHGLIKVNAGAMGTIATTSLQLDVAGNRADIFAAKAARAHAALRGARLIEEDDITFATITVLTPRGQNIPDERQTGEEEEKNDSPGGTPPDNEATQESPDGEGTDDRTPDEGETDHDTNRNASGTNEERFDETTFDPLDFNAPLVDLETFFTSSKGSRSGSQGDLQGWLRGRHTASLSIESAGKRIAVGATLRAAAPHQSERRSTGERKVVVRREDIRVKRFTERAGALFIFCVDSSGSMAMNRMREAKGAVTRLLQNAYVNRDTVALIGFRGDQAEILLPPTGSVERAKRSLDILPTGGGTPLASALVKAYGLVERARRGGIEQTLVVLLTDGRANVPISENAAGMIMEIRRGHVRRELDRIAESYRRANVASLVIDTRQHFGANSDAVRLAELLDARYFFLPRIDAGEIAAVVRNVVRG